MPDLFRYDRGELARSVKTREGFVLAEGFIAKPGVLQYIRADGTVQRELVTEAVLHDPASLATLGRKPVTLEHPEGKVNPDNVGDLAVGDVDGEVEVVTQGGFVKVRLAVRRRDALNALERGDALELSPGYGITLDETPGVHPVFGEYDAVQTSRRYNHVALTAAGRGGPSIRLRADSAFDTRLQGKTMDPKIIAALVSFMTTAGLRFDSADIADGDAKDTAGRITDLEDAFKMMKDKLDQFGGEDEEKKDQEGVEGEDEEEKTDEEAVEEMEEKADSRRLAWHARRTDLEARADSFGVKKADTMSNNALRRAVVLAARKDAKTDGSVDYYRAAFDMLPKAGEKTRTDAWSRVKPPGKTVDNNDEDTRHDADPSASWSANIAEQFKARHGDAR